MHSVWFRSTFLKVSKFLQIKEEGPNFWGEPILQKICELFGPPFSILILKILWTQIHRHSLDFNAFYMIQECFSESLDISTNWRVWGNFWGEQILQKIWIICSPLLYSNFKSFMEPNSSSFIMFHCILRGSGVLFSESWNFYNLKRRDLISGGNQFCRESQLFGPHFCILYFKVF